MLHLCVFVCGAALMIIELTGSRILAPFLGTSLIVWTSLIGIILACLSLGAWWGGLLADRRPERRLLGRIVLLAAWATAAIGLSKTWLLEALQGSAGIYLLATTASVLLFAPASILLGMVSPFAVRLCLSDTKRGGRTAGGLYALSTIGSITGTFAAGFVLIAWLGSTQILFFTAAFLVMAAFLADPSEKLKKIISLAAFALLFFFMQQQQQWLAGMGFIDRDTPYNRVLVYPSIEPGTNRPTRDMVTDPHGRQSAMYLDDPTELAVAYTRFYRLAEYFRPDMRRMLVIGGGGYSFPKYALAHYPGVQVDVVEIDPGITELARQYFALEEHPRLRIIEEDGRTYLQRIQLEGGPRYDVILCDAFSAHYSIPFHLVTVEAITLMREALAPEGVVLVNLIAAPKGKTSRFYMALHAGFADIFPEVRNFAVQNPYDLKEWQNIILAALTGPPPARFAQNIDVQQIMLDHAFPTPAQATVPPFTDEFAPVDRYLGETFL